MAPGSLDGLAVSSVASSSAGDILALASSLARPKSRIFGTPSSVTATFAGLRSRWTIPAACARASASAIGIASRSASLSGIPPFGMSLSRLLPGTSSITMKSASPSFSISWIVTMFGWLSEEAARASCTNLRLRPSSESRSAGSTLIATSRPSRGSRAR